MVSAWPPPTSFHDHFRVDMSRRRARKVELEQLIEMHDGEYQMKRKNYARIMNKTKKVQLNKAARKARNDQTQPLQAELEQLVTSLEAEKDRETNTPGERISGQEKKRVLKEIKMRYRHRNRHTDPYQVILECGQLYAKCGCMHKAEEYFLQAVSYPPSNETATQRKRKRAACVELYEYYYRLGQPHRVTKYLRMWLDLARNRRGALEAVERYVPPKLHLDSLMLRGSLLAEYETLRDTELKTREAIETSALLKEQLGR